MVLSKRRSIYDTKDEAHWPIPIWRPRAIPILPLHRRLINLLLPKPALEDVIPAIVSMDHLHNRSRMPDLPIKRNSEGFRMGIPGQRLEVHVEEDSGSVHPFMANGYQSTAPAFHLTRSEFGGVNAKSTNRRPSPPPAHLLPPPSPQLLSPHSAFSSSSRGRSTHSSRISSSRYAFVSTAQSSNYTFGNPSTSSSTIPAPAPTRPVPAERYSPSYSASDQSVHQARLLHHLRILFCLDLARRLLYTYNRSALASLACACLPPEIESEWERDLDDWWVETSGVLNTAHQRVKAELVIIERLMEAGIQGKSEKRKMQKRVLRMWNHESRSWNAQGHCVKSESEDKKRGIPVWVTDIVPKPFVQDEMEEEVWKLEAEGRIATGTWRRMYGKRQQGRKDEGWEEVEFWVLDADEEVEAGKRGLRGVDVDEQGRIERERWRTDGQRNRWSVLS